LTPDNPPKDNHQLLKEILDDLVVKNPNIFSVLVVSDDGLKVASGIPHPGDDDLSLTASNLMDSAKEFSDHLEQGRLNRIILEGEQRIIIVTAAGKRTILVVLTTPDEKLGLITMSMRRAADQIAAIFR
jgi:predicted regulator of Ras-like GTPase activity (Roadblock/LC7/MglB family)